MRIHAYITRSFSFAETRLLQELDCDCDNCSITQFAKLIKDVPLTESEVSILTTRFLEKLLILSRNETKFYNARDLT